MVSQHAWTLQGVIAGESAECETVGIGLVATFEGWALVLPRTSTDGPTTVHFTAAEAKHLTKILLGQIEGTPP